MNKQMYHIVAFFLLAIMSYGTWKYYFDEEEIIVDKPFTKGYSVDNIELKITDETGALTGMFKSPKLIRYTDNPIVHIEQPLFWTYNEGQQHWSIVSENAEYNSESQLVGLYSNLVAKTINDDTQTEFKADNLLVNLKTKIANTADGISLNKQQLSITGQIAKFDLKNETVEVNNNVKAKYKTNNRKN